MDTYAVGAGGQTDVSKSPRHGTPPEFGSET